jgi:hypothetical protein
LRPALAAVFDVYVHEVANGKLTVRHDFLNRLKQKRLTPQPTAPRTMLASADHIVAKPRPPDWLLTPSGNIQEAGSGSLDCMFAPVVVTSGSPAPPCAPQSRYEKSCLPRPLFGRGNSVCWAGQMFGGQVAPPGIDYRRGNTNNKNAGQHKQQLQTAVPIVRADSKPFFYPVHLALLTDTNPC